MVLTIRKTKRDRFREYVVASLLFLLLTAMVLYSFNWNTYTASSGSLPMTNEHEFDATYQKYMEKDMPMINDIMEPANYAGFFTIKLVTGIVGMLLLVISTVTFASAIAYGLRPDLADEVHEVKQEVANGQQIPFDEPLRFIMRFLPDVKAASGIADDYEFERPTVGLVFRNNIWKFLILYTLAIALRTNLITTFLAKTGGAVAYGARHYVDNTDMRGIINTFTSAGKDFNPQYNTLLQEERNKKKTFNAIYNAVKNQYPRERQQEFINQVGAQIVNFIQTEVNQDLYNRESFSASADVYSYGTEKLGAGITNTEIRTVYTLPMSTVLGGNFNLANSDYTIYITILAYDEKPGDSAYNLQGEPYGNSTEITGNEQTLTNVTISRTKSDADNGYKFSKKNLTQTVTATIIGQYQIGTDPWKKTETIQYIIPADKLSVADDKITISLDGVDGAIQGWLNTKESGANVTSKAWYSIQINQSDLTKAFEMVKTGSTSKDVQMYNGYSRTNRDLGYKKSE